MRTNDRKHAGSATGRARATPGGSPRKLSHPGSGTRRLGVGLGAFLMDARLTANLSRRSVAAEAKFSPSYLADVEYSDKVHPSPEILLPWCRVLELNPEQMLHALNIVRHPQVEPIVLPTNEQMRGALPCSVRDAVDHLAPYPAAVLSLSWDVLYANTSFLASFHGMPLAGNLLRWWWNDAHRVAVDWATEAALHTELWRASLGRHGVAWGVGILAELGAQHPDFRDTWATAEVAFDHPLPVRLRLGQVERRFTIQLQSTLLEGGWPVQMYMAVPT